MMNSAQGKYCGLDLLHGGIKDVIKDEENSILEPITVFMSVLKSAGETVEMILRTDENIIHRPRDPFVLSGIT